ncbi:hypothetical protein [Streptomyces sp. AP-93]|uniref:hypothetical protein n=1 Tax=Streptomyces sp. AP-93 TaxID=2929048 RepID=UPI001FAE9D38|nr:hypothetical protein [Streptomyces sp. AP-93]MCJ0868109.1 hypothetical protein [Streptomyces sp. AP-93]
MSTQTVQEVFQPSKYNCLLVAFRPVEYLETWYDGFGKTQPAMVTEFSPLERLVGEDSKARQKDMSYKERAMEKLLGPALTGESVAVEEPRARLVTVKQLYLVEALRGVQEREGISAGWVIKIQTPWVLMPPDVRNYERVFVHCKALGWV